MFDDHEQFLLSGIFLTRTGIKILKCIDENVFYGKQDLMFKEYTKKLCMEYAKRMNLSMENARQIGLNEIISELDVTYKKQKIYDRYILSMDSIRYVFHSILCKKLKEKQIKYTQKYTKEIERFNLRSKAIKKSETIISESTDVNSLFSRVL
tara:strand:- start:276 stop:731 length:456 start_codon:yes stop_codon:yes gene_type:complete